MTDRPAYTLSACAHFVGGVQAMAHVEFEDLASIKLVGESLSETVIRQRREARY
jgi:hypothetical protein